MHLAIVSHAGRPVHGGVAIHMTKEDSTRVIVPSSGMRAIRQRKCDHGNDCGSFHYGTHFLFRTPYSVTIS